MAIFKKNKFGMFTGLIGPMVVSTWKGIIYARAKKREGIIKKKGTPRQVAARGKFRYLHQFLAPFYPYITTGFAGLAVNKTEINAAFTANYHHAVLGVYPDLNIDYSKLQLSAGKLVGLLDPSLTSNAEGLIEVIWKSTMRHGGAYNDHLMLVLYAESEKETDGFIGHAQRRDHYFSFHISKEMCKGRVHVYVGLFSLNRKHISDSQYLGVLEF